jgi:hypothetical protein
MVRCKAPKFSTHCNLREKTNTRQISKFGHVPDLNHTLRACRMLGTDTPGRSWHAIDTQWAETSLCPRVWLLNHSTENTTGIRVAYPERSFCHRMPTIRLCHETFPITHQYMSELFYIYQFGTVPGFHRVYFYISAFAFLCFSIS